MTTTAQAAGVSLSRRDLPRRRARGGQVMTARRVALCVRLCVALAGAPASAPPPGEAVGADPVAWVVAGDRYRLIVQVQPGLPTIGRHFGLGIQACAMGGAGPGRCVPCVSTP